MCAVFRSPATPAPKLSTKVVAGGKTWIGSYTDDTSIWIEYGIGRRFCAWIDRLRQRAPEVLAADKPHRRDIDVILAALVQLGVPEAGSLNPCSRIADLADGPGWPNFNRYGALWEVGNMTSDLDIYRAAKLLIDPNGDEAALYAAGRADLLFEEGDAAGAATWRRIMAAVEELQRGRRPGEGMN